MTVAIAVLRSKDAAGYLAVSTRHLRRLVLLGEIKATKLGRRAVGYRLTELERYLDRKTRTAK
jgi:excisionase family DNA binding protein